MLDFLFSLLLSALLVVKNRIHFELNIPQFFQIDIDRFQLSGFGSVLRHEHFKFRLPLFLGNVIKLTNKFQKKEKKPLTKAKKCAARP